MFGRAFAYMKPIGGLAKSSFSRLGPRTDWQREALGGCRSDWLRSVQNTFTSPTAVAGRASSTPPQFLFYCSYQGGRSRAFQSLKATISKQNHFSSIQAPFALVAPCPVHRKNVGSYDSAVTWILVPFSGEASRRSASGLASRSAGSALFINHQHAEVYVTSFLEQTGKIPLTNMLSPGAMGTSQKVGPDKTVEGQAENRRVVVKILQNKGIAGS